MKRISLFAVFAMLTLLAHSQKIKGKVSDASDNSPLVGATINVAGNTVTTDKDGSFLIDCRKLAEITVSFVGYETFRQKIKNCDQELKIWLLPSSHTLENVEITAT